MDSLNRFPEVARIGSITLIAVALLTAVACIIIWQRKSWIAPYGSVTFIVALVFGTITATLRLHMWFVSQVHPVTLVPLRARVLRYIVICETLFIAIVFGMGVALTGPHDGTAAELIIIAMLMALSLIVIEPATTRASLSQD